MGNQNEPRQEQLHPLLRTADTLANGWQLEPRDIFERHLRPDLEAKGRQKKTIVAIERYLRKFEAWWQWELERWSESNGQTFEVARPVVSAISVQHLIAFREWLQRKGYSNVACNYSCAAMRQILRCAELYAIIESPPKIDNLPTRKAAPKYYLTNEDFEALWKVAPDRRWPCESRGRSRLHRPAGDLWRACLVLYRTYGFRTQELIALDSRAKPITWDCIHQERKTPNSEGHAENELGWLEYVPQKQSWCKPDPLCLPITQHTLAAFEVLRPPEWKPSDPVCNWVFSSTSFYATWHAMVSAAGIQTRAGGHFLPKNLRKTAATFLEMHRAGLAAHVLGHAADRSGQSIVSSKHYVNSESLIVDGLTTFPHPECFDEILEMGVACDDEPERRGDVDSLCCNSRNGCLCSLH